MVNKPHWKTLSQISITQTQMTRLPCLTRTRSWIPMVPYMKLLSSSVVKFLHLWFHAVIFMSYFRQGKRAVGVFSQVRTCQKMFSTHNIFCVGPPVSPVNCCYPLVVLSQVRLLACAPGDLKKAYFFTPNSYAPFVIASSYAAAFHHFQQLKKREKIP